MAHRRRILAAAALAAALPGAGFAGATVEDQRSVLLDCKHRQGVGGAAWINQTTRGAPAGTMAVAIAPYDRVTPRDAAAINACAASRLGLAPAGLRSPVAGQRTVVRSIRAPGGYPGVDCGRNPVPLYRGDLYCTLR